MVGNIVVIVTGSVSQSVDDSLIHKNQYQCQSVVVCNTSLTSLDRYLSLWMIRLPTRITSVQYQFQNAVVGNMKLTLLGRVSLCG